MGVVEHPRRLRSVSDRETWSMQLDDARQRQRDHRGGIMRSVAPVVLAFAVLPILCGLGGCGDSGTKRTITKDTIPGSDITIDPALVPDLVLADPYQMSTDSSVTVSFSVANAGGGDAANVVWRVTRADGSVVREATIPSLPSGTIVPVSVSDGPQGVNQTFTVSVDPDGHIDESHEDNNVMDVTSVYVTTAVPLDGDLALNGVHTHNGIFNPDPGFHFFIENDSGQALSGVTVTVRDEATGEDLYGLPYDETSTIAAHTIGPRSGAGDEQDGIYKAPYSDTRYASLPKATPGRHVYHVILDPTDHNAETNEANNDWRLVVDVPDGYGYWPLRDLNTDPQGTTYKTDVMFEDPHVHPADTQRYITFHGWLHNFHMSKPLLGYDPAAVSDPDYAGVAQRIVPFVVKREGVAVTLPAPGLDPNRQKHYGVGPGGKAYFILPDAGLAAAGGRLEYLFIVKEENTVGEVDYSIDLDPDDVIDEQYEGTNLGQGAIDNNHASWVVVMDPLGTSG
jgi:hypothetical protein